MNKRVKQLTEQAGFIGSHRDGEIYTSRFEHLPITEDLAKFAELIVQECMTTVLKESKWYWDRDEFESADAIRNAARRVKEHFGVEE